jgi:hypothetical protein
MTGSATKRSRASRETLDCFAFARNDGAEHRLASDIEDPLALVVDKMLTMIERMRNDLRVVLNKVTELESRQSQLESRMWDVATMERRASSVQ